MEKYSRVFRERIVMSVLVLVTAVGFAIGCAHRDVKKAQLDPQAQPLIEIQNLEKQLAEQQNSQLDVMAPAQFAKAKKYLKEAKADYEKGEDRSDVLDSIAWSKAYADKVQTVGERVKGQLEPVATARQAAMTVRAHELLPRGFRNADDDLRDLSDDLVDDPRDMDLDDVNRLQTAYLNLELDAIKKAKLSEAQTIIEKAVDQRAQRYVPQTLMRARTQYAAAEKVIENERHNDTEVNQAAEKATAEARDLAQVLALARQSKNDAPESAALKLFNQSRSLQSVESTAAALQADVTQQQQALAQQGQEISNLAKTVDLDTALKSAQAKFSEDEAEVTRQGDKLMIRLKAIQFPTNSSDFAPSSLGTLKKVKDVIAELDAEKVIIEGHTDSTGGPQINKQLSEKRAEAVKQYLVVDDVIASDKVETVGVGFDRPISSNKTAEGRAQNRRVDLVISPQSM